MRRGRRDAINSIFPPLFLYSVPVLSTLVPLGALPNGSSNLFGGGKWRGRTDRVGVAVSKFSQGIGGTRWLVGREGASHLIGLTAS